MSIPTPPSPESSVPAPPANPPAPPNSPGSPTPPPAKPADTRPRTLALIALALAAVGLIMAFIPVITWFSGLLLLAGFIVGLVALIGKKHGGTGFGIAAVVVSVAGWIVAIIMSVASFAVIGQAAVDEAVREDTAVSDESSDAATSSEEETVEEVVDDRQELAVVESAFGQNSYSSDTWWYTVILDNPNADYVFDFAEVTVEALDADGVILDSSSDYLTILSGTTAVTGTFFSVGDSEIAELSVRGPMATDATRSALDETGSLTIEGVKATTDSYSTDVHGTVSGTFESEQELVEVVVIARNASGTIIGAERTYVDRLPVGGGKVQFEVTFFDPLPGDTTYEAYATL